VTPFDARHVPPVEALKWKEYVAGGLASCPPVKATVVGEFGSSDATLKVAVFGPMVEGVKVIPIVQEAPFASVSPEQLSAATENIAASVPVMLAASDPNTSALDPVEETVTV